MGATNSTAAIATARTRLTDLGQAHLFSDWAADTPAEDELRFFQQVEKLDASYPGGLSSYVENARRLLAESKAGFNPLEGWEPSIPTGTTLSFGSDDFLQHEQLGIAELDGCSFVLVAGGLGERLGFSGIKVALPWQTTSGQTYLELYIRSILALQQEAATTTGKKVQLPLAIMVSDDTASRTEELLKANDNFGMVEGQVTLLKQEKVPCISDNDGRLALNPKDPFQIMTKPHGHGDVHYLLHSTGTLTKWLQTGVRWVYFLQDTNALAFKVLPASLGVSSKLNLHVNSVAVARTAKESIGGIMRLRHKDGREMTVNVEYNQIDALLKGTVDPRGDVAGPNGYSPYPGSINQLVLLLEPYEAQLRLTNGSMPEFVNPKYTDGTKTSFKSPTRLECMMQDYPKSLRPSAPVGFSVVSDAIIFSPVKTNLADARIKSKAGEPTYSAPSGESDAYSSACEMLAASGVRIPKASFEEMGGVHVAMSPRVVIDPSFGVGVASWRAKLPTPEAIRLTRTSTLLLQGELKGLRIESLNLAGTLVVRMCAGANVTLRRVHVANAGWAFKTLWGSEGDEALDIRGYKVVRQAQRELVFSTPGDYIVEDDEPAGFCSML